MPATTTSQNGMRKKFLLFPIDVLSVSDLAGCAVRFPKSGIANALI